MDIIRLILLTATMLAVPGLAAAENARGPVLVELYTSQGCSSCPPADAFLHRLAARDDVIALALHVDYWDYIFDDVFGKAAHTKRQYGYAAAGGRDMVYTPQMIIDGQEHVVGNRPKDVTAVIERHLSEPSPITLSVEREAGNIVISANAEDAFHEPLVVQIARYIPEQTVSISHGENAGHSYSYINIVTDIVDLGQWDPSEPLAMKVRAKDDAPIAVILQRPAQGKVEATALLR